MLASARRSALKSQREAGKHLRDSVDASARAVALEVAELGYGHMGRARPLMATAKPLGQKVLSCGCCHSLQPAQPILGGRHIQVQHLRKTAAQIFRELHRERHTASTVCYTWQPLAPISHFLGAGWSARIACHPGTNPARRHVQAQSLHRGTYSAADGLSQQAYWHTVQPRMGLNQSVQSLALCPASSVIPASYPHQVTACRSCCGVSAS